VEEEEGQVVLDLVVLVLHLLLLIQVLVGLIHYLRLQELVSVMVLVVVVEPSPPLLLGI
jgi:hypothetical protein